MKILNIIAAVHEICLTLCLQMDSSFWLNTITGVVHCTYLGVSVYNYQKYFILLSEDLFTFTNSVDPDKMQHNTRLGVSQLQRVKATL